MATSGKSRREILRDTTENYYVLLAEDLNKKNLEHCLFTNKIDIVFLQEMHLNPDEKQLFSNYYSFYNSQTNSMEELSS